MQTSRFQITLTAGHRVSVFGAKKLTLVRGCVLLEDGPISAEVLKEDGASKEYDYSRGFHLTAGAPGAVVELLAEHTDHSSSLPQVKFRTTS